jgi:hypothetical protein
MTPRLKAGLALGAMFLLGGATGFAGGRAVVLAELRKLYDGPPLALRQKLTLAALDRHVDLSAAQRAQVDEVVARYEPEILQLRADIAPRAVAIRDRLLADLEALMTAEQRDGYARFRAYVEERSRAQGER